MKSKDLFQQHLAQTTEHALGLEIERAEGSYLYDINGNPYLDFISGISVSAFGHGHPRIKKALKDQIDQHLHVMVYGEFIQNAQNRLAKALLKTLPSELDSFYFVNSGAEAIEAALKLAKRSTGRQKIMAFKGAYHGSTHGALSVSWNEERKKDYRPLLPNIHFLEWNVEAELQQITEKTAAVILESIQGDAGVRIPYTSFMQALRQRCNETGSLLILDEIQCGMGRTGKMWAFEHFGIVPDMMTAGKALGAGLPIGCLAASKALMANFSHSPSLGHITTFGGHPLPCSAAAEGLNILEEEQLLDQIVKKGNYIEEKINHPSIQAIRRKGLMLAIELESEVAVDTLVSKAMERGLILFWFLSTPNAFRIAPPYTISTQEINEGCGIVHDILDELM